MERIEIETPNCITAPLYGQHTLETCFLDCSIGSTSDKDTIKSNCIVMVGKDSLQFVILTKVDQIDIIRAFRKGAKYQIRFRLISDIEIVRIDDSENKKNTKAAESRRDTKPKSIVLHLNGEAFCKIDTNHNVYSSTHLARQIQSAWHSSIILRSAHLPKLNALADSSIADEYLHETINSLKHSSKNQFYNNISDDKTSEIEEIYSEFASEAWTDLELKEATCKSRELFVSSILFCQELISSPAPRDTSSNVDRAAFTTQKQRQGFQKGSSIAMSINASSSSQFQGTARNLFTEKTQVDLQSKLQSIALQRLKLIRTTFKAMASILFCSETCSSRFGLLGGPEPLNLDTWCSLLASDLYVLICKTLGCAPEEEEEQVIAAINQSIAQSLSLRASQLGKSGTPSTLRKNVNSDTYRECNSTIVSSLVRRIACDNISDSLLTPIRQRKSKMTIECNESTSLVQTQRGVKDLQIIIAYELARITTTGYSSLNKNVVLSKNPRKNMTPFQIKFFGEFYAHQIGWENSLEDLLIRISTLLDDMLCSASITSNMAGLRKSVQNLQGNEKNKNSQMDNGGVGGGGRRSACREGDGSINTNRGMVTPRGITPGKMQSTPLRVSIPEIGDVMRSSVDVDLASLGRSQVSVPQSPCRTSKKNPSNMKNRPPINSFFPEINEEIDVSTLRSPLETQEILLFYTISLIQTMALDSAKIRAVLASDLKSYWMPIMHVLNNICPRPILESKKNLISGLLNSSNIPDPSCNEIKKKFFLSGFFKSKTVTEKKIVENEKVEEFNWTSRLATVVTEDLEHLSISDYGPAQYNMSDSSWWLLVMTRRATEEVVIMLGLHGGVEEGGPEDGASVPFRLMEPTALQIKRNDEQERKSRSNAQMNRAFDDEDGRQSLDRPGNVRKDIDIGIDTDIDRFVDNKNKNGDEIVQNVNKNIDEIPLSRNRKIFRRRSVESSSHDEFGKSSNENKNDDEKENNDNRNSDKDVKEGITSSSYALIIFVCTYYVLEET